MDEIDKVAEDLLATTCQYQQNYEQLKDQHVSLKEDYSLLEKEYIELLEESKLVKDKYVTMLNMAHSENQHLKQECANAKKMALTPKQVEIIRLDTWEELRAEYQQKISELEEENGRLLQTICTNEQKHIQNESEMETKMQDKSNLAESLQQKIQQLEEEHSTNIRQLVSDRENESFEVELIKTRQENAQLSVTVQELRSELRAKNSELHNQTLKHTKSYNKFKKIEIELKNKNIEHSTNIESISNQNERLARQLEEETKRGQQREMEFTTLTGEIEEFRREIEKLSSLAVSGVHNMQMEMKVNLENEQYKNKKLQMQVEELDCKLDVASQSTARLKRKLANKDTQVAKEVEAFQKKAAKSEAVYHRLRINAEKNCNELKEKLKEESNRHQRMTENLQQKYEERLASQKAELSDKLNEANFSLRKIKSEQFLSDKSTEDLSATKRALQDAVENNNQLISENGKLKGRIQSLEEDITQKDSKLDSVYQCETGPIKSAGKVKGSQNLYQIERRGKGDMIEELRSRILAFEKKLYAQEKCFHELNLLGC